MIHPLSRILSWLASGVLCVAGSLSVSAAIPSPSWAVSSNIGSAQIFGLEHFGLEASDQHGQLDSQAGDHPYEMTSTFSLTTGPHDEAVGKPKQLNIDLPAGLVINPTSTPGCALEDFLTVTQAGQAGCAAGTEVGSVAIETESGSMTSSPIYNLISAPGYFAQLGFRYGGADIVMHAELIPSALGDALRITVPDLPRASSIVAGSLTFYGDPSEHVLSGDLPAAFLTNPDDCGASSLPARIEADSWEEPDTWVSAESVAYNHITGCGLLPFVPTLSMAPATTQADEPSGYQIDLRFPQTPGAGGLAPAEIESASVTFPAGVSLSLAAMEGLTACSQAQIDLESTQHEACPATSILGTIEIDSSLVPSPLSGHVYLATSNSFGSPISLYADAEDPTSGVVIKLPMELASDPATGKLVLRLEGMPQIPISTLKLDFAGGARALLDNPQTCGSLSATSDLQPWGTPDTPDASPSSAFSVDWDGAGGSCPVAFPFEPALSTSPAVITAGGQSPFNLAVSRSDRQQDLSTITVEMPPGLATYISGLPACQEPEASYGACPHDARIGASVFVVGSGQQPIQLAGLVYLTAPYRGAISGLSIVVPVLAGPLDLGTVIVRAQIYIDPETGVTKIISDRLPMDLDGISLRLRTVSLMLDVMFSPLGCASGNVVTTVTSPGGATAQPSSPLTLGGCLSLNVSSPPVVDYGPAPRRTPVAQPSIAHVGERLTGNRLLVGFTVPTPGLMTISGSAIHRYMKRIQAGSHEVRLPLSRIGVVDRRHHRRIKLQLTLHAINSVLHHATTVKL